MENAGKGISCFYSDLNVQICYITGNTGSGIYCLNSNPIIQNVTILENSGSGIYCNTSNPIVKNTSIVSNSAPTSFNGKDGGGIKCFNSNPILQNIFIANNFAEDDGGGIYFYFSNPTIKNAIISGNSADDQGGGIFSYNSNPSIYNSTISGNAAGNDGGGIKCYESNIELFNSIFWENSSQEISFKEVGAPNSIGISYSDIQGGEAGIVTNGNGTINWLEGNINEDPHFEGSGDHPYMLSNESPCVNAGTPDTTGLNLPELDLAGNPRIYGDRIDIGVYENQEVVVATKESIHQILSTDVEIYPNPTKNNIFISIKDEETIKGINIYNQIWQSRVRRVVLLAGIKPVRAACIHQTADQRHAHPEIESKLMIE